MLAGNIGIYPTLEVAFGNANFLSFMPEMLYFLMCDFEVRFCYDNNIKCFFI